MSALRLVARLLVAALLVTLAETTPASAYYPSSAFTTGPNTSCAVATDVIQPGWTTEKPLTEGYDSTDTLLGDSTSPYLLFTSPGVATLRDTADRVEGCASLDLSIPFSNYVETKGVQRLHVPDLSYAPYGLSLRIKRTGTVVDAIDVRLDEDNNANGVFDGTDEVWSARLPVTPTVWTRVNVPYTQFARVAGAGNNTLDHAAASMVELMVINESATPHTARVKVDDLRQLTNAALPTARPTLSGTFVQFDPAAGGSSCNTCLDWTQTQWTAEFTRMKNAGITKVILQDVAALANPANTSGGVTLYPTTRSWVTTQKTTTLDRVFSAAGTAGIKLVVSNLATADSSGDACNATRFSQILAKSKNVVDDIWSRYGTNTAFAGWYITQEVDEAAIVAGVCNTASFTATVGAYYRDIAAYMAAKKPLLGSGKPVYIAPSTTASLRVSAVRSLWSGILATATGITDVVMQDGVGQYRSDGDVDVAQFNGAVKTAATAAGRRYGTTIESFRLQNPGGAITTRAATIDELKSQLRFAGPLGGELFSFHWFNMSTMYGASGTALYNGYLSYRAGA